MAQTRELANLERNRALAVRCCRGSSIFGRLGQIHVDFLDEINVRVSQSWLGRLRLRQALLARETARLNQRPQFHQSAVGFVFHGRELVVPATSCCLAASSSSPVDAIAHDDDEHGDGQENEDCVKEPQPRLFVGLAHQSDDEVALE